MEKADPRDYLDKEIDYKGYKLLVSSTSKSGHRAVLSSGKDVLCLSRFSFDMLLSGLDFADARNFIAKISQAPVKETAKTLYEIVYDVAQKTGLHFSTECDGESRLCIKGRSGSIVLEVRKQDDGVEVRKGGGFRTWYETGETEEALEAWCLGHLEDYPTDKITK